MKKALALMLVSAGSCLPVAQAEYLGQPNARSANPGSSSMLSVGLGYVTGNLGEVDYQNLGARVNYRLSPEVVLMADIGISEFGDYDGTPFGVGVFYYLSKQRITQQADIAAKASYHSGEYSQSGAAFDISGFSFEVLFSGVRPLFGVGLNWYANTGIHQISVDLADNNSTTEFGLGAGVTLPTSFGEAYAGVDIIDEATLGIGLRYFVK